MTFNPLAGAVVAELLQYLPRDPSVMELGNQRFTVSDEILKEIIKNFRNRATKVDTDILASFLNKSREEKYPLTEAFYLALGFRSYSAIDVNSKYGSLIMDLNYDLRAHYEYSETFDLITNNGTGEHIFNQFTVLKNMHSLTSVGGIMLHIMPFVNWINHGFYSFHPILYADLAAANDYKVVKFSIANRWGFEVPVNLTRNHTANQLTTSNLDEVRKGLKPVQKFIQRLGISKTDKVTEIAISDLLVDIRPSNKGSVIECAIQSIIKHEKDITGSNFPNVMVVAALRKQTDRQFIVPMQGKYVRDIEESEISRIYEEQVKPTK